MLRVSLLAPEIIKQDRGMKVIQSWILTKPRKHFSHSIVASKLLILRQLLLNCFLWMLILPNTAKFIQQLIGSLQQMFICRKLKYSFCKRSTLPWLSLTREQLKTLTSQGFMGCKQLYLCCSHLSFPVPNPLSVVCCFAYNTKSSHLSNCSAFHFFQELAKQQTLHRVVISFVFQPSASQTTWAPPMLSSDPCPNLMILGAELCTVSKPDDPGCWALTRVQTWWSLVLSSDPCPNLMILGAELWPMSKPDDPGCSALTRVQTWWSWVQKSTLEHWTHSSCCTMVWPFRLIEIFLTPVHFFYWTDPWFF